MATIECVGIIATGFSAFRCMRNVAALDLASWAGATVPTSAWERGHGGAMARVGVEHGVGLGLDLGLGLGLGPGRTGLGGGGGPWAEGAPPPPRSSGSHAVPVVYAIPKPSKLPKWPPVASPNRSLTRGPKSGSPGLGTIDAPPIRSPIFLLYFQSRRPCHQTRHLPPSHIHPWRSRSRLQGETTEIITMPLPSTAALAEYRRKLDAGEVAAPERKTPWQKLRENPTLKRMVVAKCHECMGWQEGDGMPPGVRSDIRDCTAAGCPLFGARPYRRADVDGDE